MDVVVIKKLKFVGLLESEVGTIKLKDLVKFDAMYLAMFE
jgi:hypothetical protein